jgi:putative tricarboxylic transport membrane protein
VIHSSGLWGGLFWLAIGVFVTWAGRDMGLGQLSDPGPGFAFFWVGILMCAFALIIIGQVIRRPDATLASLWDGTRWGKVLIVVALLLVYGAGFSTIGFIPSTLVLLLVLMLFIDPVDWRVAVVIAVAATFGVWAALSMWLKIQLPAGVFAGIFG